MTKRKPPKKRDDLRTAESKAFGRPPKYRPEYCAKLIEHMSKGYSYESFAGVINAGRTTLYYWEKQFEDFADAKKLGVERNLMFWENKGVDNLYAEKDGPMFNTTLWIFNMKNRHKWADRHDVGVSKTPNDEERERIKALSNQQLLEEVKKVIE